MAGFYGLYNEVVLDANGNLVINVPTTVLIFNTTTAATLYSDFGGTAPVANPINTDYEGNLTFYAAPGLYTISGNNDGTPFSATIQVAASPLDFPTVQPTLRVNSTNAQAIAATTYTIVIFNNINWDTANGYNASTGVYTVPVAGKYRVFAQTKFGGTAITGTCFQEIYHNGINVAISPNYYLSGGYQGMTVGDTVQCAAGDTLSIAVYLGSSGTMLDNAPYPCAYMTIEKIAN